MPDRRTLMLKLCGVSVPKIGAAPKPPQAPVDKPGDKVRQWLRNSADAECASEPDDTSSAAPNLPVPHWFSDVITAATQPALQNECDESQYESSFEINIDGSSNNDVEDSCSRVRPFFRIIPEKSSLADKSTLSDEVMPAVGQVKQSAALHLTPEEIVRGLNKAPAGVRPKPVAVGRTKRSSAELDTPEKTLSPTAHQLNSTVQAMPDVGQRQPLNLTPDETVIVPGNNNNEQSSNHTRVRKELFPPDIGHEDPGDLVSDLEAAGVDLSNELLVLPLDEDLLAREMRNVDGALPSGEENGVSASHELEEEPRKRIRNPSTWKKNINKRQRNTGQACKTAGGKQREAVVMGPTCNCPRKCSEKLSQAEREKIHKTFWELGDPSTQWDFLAKCIEFSPVKRRTTENDPVKKLSFKYKLMSVTNQYVYICRDMFLHTLSVSASRIRTTIHKLLRKRGIVSPDKRGKHVKLKATSKLMKASVIEHVNKFPRVESHYCRKKSKLKYLDEHLNVRKMHSLYMMEYGHQANAANLRQYQDVFRSEFSHKLKFFKPKKDQCSTCLLFKYSSAAEKEKGQEKQDKHISNKNVVRALKESDILEASNNPSICVCTFDLEKTLYSPKGDDAQFYYLSKLKLYNFTIFQNVAQKGFCYVWDETTAHRGANEFASCLLSFIQQKSREGVKKFIFYSDNCSSQNKNQFLYSLYNYVSHKYDVEIVHRYLEVGHTQMECDSMHALIERRSKSITVYAPTQWYAIIKTAKVTAPRYEVKEMTQTDFLDFSDLSKLHVWTRVPIKQVREITVFKNAVTYKKEYDDAPTAVTVMKVQRGRPIKLENIQLKPAYSGRLPIAHRVLEGLKGLCSKGSIPEAYHDFYNGITSLPPEPRRKRKTKKRANQAADDEQATENVDDPDYGSDNDNHGEDEASSEGGESENSDEGSDEEVDTDKE